MANRAPVSNVLNCAEKERSSLLLMIRTSRMPRLRSFLSKLTPFVLLFGGAVLAVWISTKSRQAPQLILLGLLYLITINLSLPLRHGGVGLAPMVSMNSILVLGPSAAFYLLLISSILAETMRPLWEPIWDFANLEPVSPWRRRMSHIGRIVVLVLSLIVATNIYELLAGDWTNVESRIVGADQLGILIWASIGYGITFTTGSYLLWLFLKHSRQPFPYFLTLLLGFLLHPFAFLGAIVFWRNGMPAFVVFCLGVMGFSIVFWLYWQRGFSASQRLIQFSRLNEIGNALRGTLDLSEVLEITLTHVNTLFPNDEIALVLSDGYGRLPTASRNREDLVTLPPSPVDGDTSENDQDLIRWVIDNQKVLRLDRGNLHFAAHHGLTLPPTTPAAWLGVPLVPGKQSIGAIVVQRFGEDRPFTQWSEEMLVAMAGHVSAAIANALMHGETVRLYDLTDEALSRRIEQLQALVYAMKEGVLVLNTAGNIVLINPVMMELLGPMEGFSVGQAVPADAIAHRIGYERQRLVQLLDELKDGNTSDVEPVIYRLEMNEPSAHRFMLRTETPVESESGEVMGWLMLFRDVTEEQELSELRSDLTRMVIHDLRNPLTTLASTIDLVQEQLPAGELSRRTEVAVLLRQARRSGADMLDMVDSLMDINKMEAGQAVADVEEMRLPLVTERVIEQLQPLARQKGVEIELEQPSDLPAAWADADMIRRVLMNLLDNALKYTPVGGTICVELSAEAEETTSREAGVRCTIQDTGPGIPPAFRDKVFTRFTRTNPGGAQVRGTGLGLTFCKLAIEAHKGKIWVEDIPGGGGCFVFTLPGVPRFNQDSD